MKHCITLFVLWGTILRAYSQGTAFTYQGQLTDGYGPASGLYDLRFAIYDAPSSGVVVGGPVTNAMTAVSNGLFTVTLNFGASVFTGAERWLEIGVSTNGAGAFTALSPRQALTSTPYAIRAANFSGPVAASQLTGTISPNNIAAGSITGVKLAAGAVGSNQLATGAVNANALAAGAVTTAALANSAVTAEKIATVAVVVSVTTFTNPTPAKNDFFGNSVAAVGNDRVLIGTPWDGPGATGFGAAYLFNLNGTLLTTITNPMPVGLANFGIAVAAVGNDRLLIGASGDNSGAGFFGAAYLFATNGTLLATMTNPTPASLDKFGDSVAAVGSDRLLVGARLDDAGATDAGAAYLFATNGALLVTFTNPAPTQFSYFGTSVAGVGNGSVLIGAPTTDGGAIEAGAAYLFSTNGTLITTFTNPTLHALDRFGGVVAAMGSDRVLIGAQGFQSESGIAYLFRTNGAWLATFTNPTPANLDEFGISVAAVGNDRVLIGAYDDDTAGPDAGAAYLFSTNGTLLTTFTDPAPTLQDGFGISLTAIGNNRVLIGAPFDDTGTTNAGAAFLFNLDFYTPGLEAEAVRAGGVTSASIATGAVTSEQLAAGAVGSNQLASAAVTTAALADGAVTATKLATASNWFVTTIANPTPAIDDDFGLAVAAVGNDRVLVGAPQDDTGASQTGAAYLFDLNGQLLTTFTNPAPAVGDNFGYSVAGLGSDRVIIGAWTDSIGASNAGSVYLFSTNGTLLTTITNPTPAIFDNFGYAVAAVGSDRVLVGAVRDDTGATDTGAAYLFSTNGVLLNTLTNPTPAANDTFGVSVAALGSDRVLIGANGDNAGATQAGVAYLFRTNGVLLTTFTNPTPAASDFFGSSVAAVGNDRVLISAPNDDTGATNAGAVYLFSTNGTLLITFTNPTPALDDHFGYSVAAVGNDRVLIGANGDNTGGDNAGAAYLFSTDGTLLATFTSPNPSANVYFGSAVAAVGSDRVLIGAYQDNTGAPFAGAAYLFGIETYAPGLVADSVRAGSVTTASLEDGAVTVSKLQPTIGIWTRSGNDVFRPDGNVGIGTSLPLARLHLSTTFTGEGIRMQGPSSGAANLAYLSFTDASGTRIGYVGDGSAGDVSVFLSSDAGDVVLNTVAGRVLTATSGGRVGIARTPAANALEVEGNASKSVSGGWLANSDARIKTGVRTVTHALEKLEQVRLVEFRYTEEYRAQHPSIEDRDYLNVVAQEFQQVFPEAVKCSGDKLPNGDEILQVDTHPLTIYSAAAIQELNRKMEDLKSQLSRRDAENAELKQRLEKLEKLLDERSKGATK